MLTAIQNALFFTGTEYLRDQFLVFEDDKIIGFYDDLDNFQDIKILDFKNKFCVPGFIDLQINGGAGIYFIQDFSLDAIDSIARTYRKYGTTSFFPTQVSTGLKNIYNGIHSVREAMKNPLSGVLGIHVEGPFLNPVKRGAHQVRYVIPPTMKELEKMIAEGKDTIGLLTIAPELFSDEQLKLLRDSGIRLSAGHSNATFEQAKTFYKKGISKVTHLYNAMSAFQSRDPGLIGAFFDSPELYGGIIADGKHVDYTSLRIAHRLKKGKLFFVTDSVFVDFRGTKFEFDGFNIRLENGAFVNEENNLAGAAITMQDAIYNSINYAQIPEEDAFRMATSIPAEYLDMSDRIGNLKAGAFADFVILDEEYQIEEVYFRGVKH
jgi:N-acetylglucosamine-6-phosphate deacetylase